MTTSLTDFERRAIWSIVAHHPEAETFARQAEAAQVARRELTGVGKFVHLALPDGTPSLQKLKYPMEELKIGHARHPALEAGAGLILWVKEGRMNTLECYTNGGDWPEDEDRFTV